MEVEHYAAGCHLRIAKCLRDRVDRSAWNPSQFENGEPMLRCMRGEHDIEFGDERLLVDKSILKCREPRVGN